MERVAGELGGSAGILEEGSGGPDAASRLHERMHALGLSRADVDHTVAPVCCATCNGHARAATSNVGAGRTSWVDAMIRSGRALDALIASLCLSRSPCALRAGSL